MGLVKNWTLELDKSLTVGQAIDNYKFFKKTRWEAIKTDNSRKVVHIFGEIDTGQHPSLNSNSLPDLKGAEMQFQLVINADKTFQMAWCGIKLEKKDRTKVEPQQNANTLAFMNSLKAIYGNSPNI